MVMDMAEKEDKFIVVNIKKLKDYQISIELDGICADEGRSRRSPYLTKGEKKKLLGDIEAFHRVAKAVDNMDHKYVVINQDEPYANAVWDIIIAFENLKEKK